MLALDSFRKSLERQRTITQMGHNNLGYFGIKRDHLPLSKTARGEVYFFHIGDRQLSTLDFNVVLLRHLSSSLRAASCHRPLLLTSRIVHSNWPAGSFGRTLLPTFQTRFSQALSMFVCSSKCR